MKPSIHPLVKIALVALACALGSGFGVIPSNHIIMITMLFALIITLIERQKTLAIVHANTQEAEKRFQEKTSELERFKAIIDHMGEEFFLIDQKGRFTYFNEIAGKSLGYQPEELLQLGVEDIDPDYINARRCERLQEIKERPIPPFEVRHKTKEGQFIPKELRMVYLLLDGKEFIGCFTHDITERKQAEAALIESESKFRALAETSPANIIIVQEGRLRYINPSAEQIMGYDPGELLNLDFFRIIHHEDRERIADNNQKRLSGEIPTGGGEFRIVRKDGQIRWLGYIASRFIFEGKPAIIGSAFDITEQNEGIRRLQESEEKYRSIFRAVNDVIFIINPNTLQLIECNPRAMELFGFSYEELCNKGAMLIHPKTHPYTIEDSLLMIRKALEEGPQVFEWLAIKKSGETFWTEVGLQSITMGGQPRIIAVVRDISERKRAEEWAKEQEKIEAIKEGDRLKDQFLSIVSHELRTPLNAVMGFGSLLEDGVFGPLQAEQNDAVGKIMEGANRMLGLVNNLLDLARIQAGELNFSFREVYYSDLMGEALAFLKPLADERCIRINTDIRVADPFWIDDERIFQLLANLITNAIKFSRDGDDIWIRAYQEDGDIITEVSDSGMGIAPEDLPKLFIPFKQLDMSLTRKIGGTGLGLSISKGIVEAHGGSIEVMSPGIEQGSTFRFSIPTVANRVGGGD